MDVPCERDGDELVIYARILSLEVPRSAYLAEGEEQ
jgi:hypothetical protein